MTRQLYALISLADKEHMKTKELEVESTFWHAKCDQLTEELESLKPGSGERAQARREASADLPAVETGHH
jgi:hypothetical protein